MCAYLSIYLMGLSRLQEVTQYLRRATAIERGALVQVTSPLRRATATEWCALI